MKITKVEGRWGHVEEWYLQDKAEDERLYEQEGLNSIMQEDKAALLQAGVEDLTYFYRVTYSNGEVKEYNVREQ